MSARSLPRVIGSLTPADGASRLWGGLIVAVVAAIAAGYVSSAAVLVTALVVLGLVAYLSFRTPRLMLAVLVFTPLVDRYLIRILVAPRWQPNATLLSEALLMIAAVAVFVHARREGRLAIAFRDPVVGLAALFTLVAVVSAVSNADPLVPALLGILVTIDGFFVFGVTRAAGFDARQGVRVIWAYAAIAVAAAVLALGQVILAPDILGLSAFNGRFNEGLRPGSIFIGQPNMLASVVALAAPFTLFAALQPGLTRGRRGLILSLAGILFLALIYTFSRGTWLALGVAMVIGGLVVDRRALGLAVGIGSLALVIALALPRGLLLPPESEWSIDLANATFGRLDALSQGNDLRIKFIQNALPIVEDHPWIGSGPGTYGGGIAARYGSALYSTYTDGAIPADRTVDNYWLHIVVEFGLAGAALLIGMVGWLASRLYRAARASEGIRRATLAGIGTAVIVSALISVTEMLLEGNTTTFPLFFMLAIASGLVLPPVSAPSDVDGRSTAASSTPS